MWRAWSSGGSQSLWALGPPPACLLLGEKNNSLVFGLLVFGYCLTCSWEHSINTGRPGLPLYAQILATRFEGEGPASRSLQGDRAACLGPAGPSNGPAWKHPPKRVWRPNWILSFGNLNWTYKQMAFYLTEEGDIKTKMKQDKTEATRRAESYQGSEVHSSEYRLSTPDVQKMEWPEVEILVWTSYSHQFHVGLRPQLLPQLNSVI